MVVLDEDDTKDDTDMVSLKRIRRKIPIAQPEDVKGLFQMFEMIKMVESRFRLQLSPLARRVLLLMLPQLLLHYQLLLATGPPPPKQEQGVRSP